MKPFDYKLTQVSEKIFALEIPNNWDRAMVFLRAQEFYESASPQFKNKNFDVWDYLRWYAVERNISTGAFDYPLDWAAYNIPIKTVVKSLDIFTGTLTPYDIFMDEILHEIFNKYGVTEYDTYLVGVKDLSDKNLKHELSHALWYTEPAFKKEANSLLKTVPTDLLKEGKATLTKMGYHKEVLVDEFVAYTSTGDMKRLIKSSESYKTLEKPFKSLLTKYLTSLKIAA
jgi:hypothetical protein